jgi:hypothetical protein
MNNTPIPFNEFFDFKLYITPELLKLPNGEYSLIIALDQNAKGAIEMDTLQKIISAIGYDLDRDVILLENQLVSSIKLHQQYQVKAVISFGVPLFNLGINIESKLYEPLEIRGIGVLKVEDLSLIAKDKSKKLLLWNGLKLMFGL